MAELDVFHDSAFTMYSQKEYYYAVEKILQHGQSVKKFQPVITDGFHGEIKGDFTLARLSHNNFLDCQFRGNKLNGIAGAGSLFKDVIFENVDLSHSGFQDSIIEQCHYIKSDLSNTNFSKCYIDNTEWIDCEMSSLNFSESRINNCKIYHCLSNPGNMSGCIFDNFYMEDVRFTNLNLEYSHFNDIQMKNVVLPFSQMPYIFGGLTYLFTTDDEIYISSHINSDNRISIDEYIDVLKNMEIFYSYRQEYFPLINIFLAFNKNKEALAALESGLKKSAKQSDFRMCKYYCELISQYGHCTPGQLKKLYDFLVRQIDIETLSDAQYYQYQIFHPQIKALLVDNTNSYSHATIELDTNICHLDMEKIYPLIAEIDYYLHLNEYSLNSPSISISHNSPIKLLINLCSVPKNIIRVAKMIINITKGICETYNSVAAAINGTEEILLTNSKIENEKLLSEKTKEEINHTKLMNAQLEQQLRKSQYHITESGIIVAHFSIENMDFNPYKWLATNLETN